MFAPEEETAMTTRWYRVVSAVLLGAAVTALGCKPPPSKRSFNNRMAEANTDLEKAARACRKALFPKDGKDFDPDQVDLSTLQGAVDGMSSALSKVKSKYEEADLPRRSGAAPALLSAYTDYLAAESKILEKTQEISAVLEDKDKKWSKAEKKDKVDQLLSEIRTLDAEAFKKVEDAQKSYSEAHFFKLVRNLD